MSQNDTDITSPWLRRLAILGGADGRVLDRAPSETGRFVTMFFVLLSTAVLSAISMVFALTTGVHAPLLIALVVGGVWMLIIFNLDRFLTATMKSSRNIWRLVLFALPRVAMAALIGLTVAVPLVLQIFRSEIEQEMLAINTYRSTVDAEASKDSATAKMLEQARQELQTMENQARTGIVAGTESGSASVQEAQATVDRLKAEIAEQQQVFDDALALRSCELTGVGYGTVPGCSGIPANGPNAKAAETAMNNARRNIDSLDGQLDQANRDLIAAENASRTSTASTEARNKQEAEAALPALKEAFELALAAHTAAQTELVETNAEARGLLKQIDALDKLSNGDPERGTPSNPALSTAHRTLTLLFFMIELLPVLVKMLTSYGDKSLYEEIEEQDKRAFIEQAKTVRNDERWEEQERSRARREQVEDMLEREKVMAKSANKKIADQMEVVLDKTLQAWSQQLVIAPGQSPPGAAAAPRRAASRQGASQHHPVAGPRVAPQVVPAQQPTGP